MIVLELHDASATLVCRGDGGCGALIPQDDADRHRASHAEPDSLSEGQARQVQGMIRTESGWRPAGTDTS